MIKAFLFDYDGVITKAIKDGTFAGRLAKNLNVPAERAAEWIMPMWRPLLKGEITDEDVWRHIEKQYGKPISREQQDIWFTWGDLTPLPEMIELLRRLKSSGYIVGVLSNVFENTMKVIRKNGGYDEFDFTILSCEVGCAKPDPEIFQLALKKLKGIQPNEIVFLDDREPAIITANKLGLHTLLVSNNYKAIDELERLIRSE